MNRWFGLVWLAFFAALSSASLSAQWPLYPKPDLPKGPDGKPNLAAPAPRTADGRPDLSGIWFFDTRREPNPPADRPPRLRGLNAGSAFKEGLPYQSWAAELQKKRSGRETDPDGLCLPQGLLEFHIDPQPFKIVQTPKEIYIFYETNAGLRTIYMDRPLPPQGVPQPWWNGYSVGRWEGDTLVVETNNFKGVDPRELVNGVEPRLLRGVGWLDHSGSPYSDALKVTEKFRRVNYGQIEVEFTVDDPKAYTKPFTLRLLHRLEPNGSELIEYVCNENDFFLEITGQAPPK